VKGGGRGRARSGGERERGRRSERRGEEEGRGSSVSRGEGALVRARGGRACASLECGGGRRKGEQLVSVGRVAG
jgi:hypothetical protein